MRERNDAPTGTIAIRGDPIMQEIRKVIRESNGPLSFI